MPPRLSLKKFLSTARTALTGPAPQRHVPLTFVVGNESADLDSLCSAVICAYIRSNSPPHTLHIPLSNLPRADLALRTEMTDVLKHAGLVPEDLLTLSELPDLKPEETQWVLVDHNALTGELKKFQNQVVGVVDHHVDEKVTKDDVVPRVIEPCGSCTSLVISEYRSAWDAFPPLDKDDSTAATEDDRLARLSLAPVLIDTINLTEESKVKEKDLLAVDYLESKILDKHFNQKAFFDEVTAVKEDISKLSFRDIFRKDYKEWEEAGLTLGICCVVQNFDYLLDKAGEPGVLIKDLADWAEERKLDVVSVMTTSNPGGEFQRHLLVWGVTDKGLEAAYKFPEIGKRLQLEQWRDGLLDDGKKRLAWRQKDLTSSRKQVGPLLREALKAAGGSS
ncbi:Putative exopolyphosphatase [Cladobotryum mycophilum]|uniref:Exopolyphosphatase n=1 Tax=Cladobotryum mycophilum TaxID=491253 RepID=A0ABR0SGM6_9HYPO